MAGNDGERGRLGGARDGSSRNNSINTNYFSVAHLNVRSLNTGFDEFSQILHTLQFDIIGLSETWLTPDHDSCLYFIPGYKLLREDRTGRGGGVGFFIKNSMMFSRIYFANIPEGFEYICVSTTIDKKKVLIISVYRPPTYNLNTFLNTIETIWLQTFFSYETIILLGDVNVDFLGNSPEKNKFLNIVQMFHLKQRISEYTRFDPITESSKLIDILISSDNETFQKSFSKPVSDTLSDHNLVYAQFKMTGFNIAPKFIQYRDYQNINIDLFDSDGLNLNWGEIYRTDNLDSKVELFNKNILHLVNKHAPLKTKKIHEKPYTPWITPNIKYLMKLRDKAFKRFQDNKTPANRRYYQDLRNYTKHALLREKITFFNQMSREAGKAFWTSAKKLNFLGKQRADGLPESLSDPQKINQYFEESTNIEDTTSKEKIQFYKSNKLINQNFSLQLLSEHDLKKYINDIKTNAVGEDLISIKDIKLCLPFCLKPLLNIMNTAILKNQFPNIWKKAIITPLPKNSNPKDFKDIRPISILPVVSKVLEKHMYNQINEFVNCHKIIPNCQSGFRKNHSTTTALSKILNDIRSNSDKSQNTLLALLDFSKAFDTINHELMLAKLHYFGFSRDSVELCTNYLDARQHCTAIKKHFGVIKSNYVTMGTGVPQGSILSTLFFSIYVADIPECIKHSELEEYADDLQIHIPFSIDNLEQVQEQFNADLKSINMYAKDHNLKLNPQKSNILLFCCNKQNEQATQNKIKIKIDETEVPLVTEAKNLGIIFDTQLNFKSHISKKVQIAYMRLKNLYKYNHSLPSKTKYYLCNSLILSLFDYGDIVYGESLTGEVAHTIQKIQNACIRFSFSIPFRNHITPHLKELSILNMENRRKAHTFTLIHKILKTAQPPYLKQLFQPHQHQHGTRNANSFKIPKHRTTNFEKSFAYFAIKYWNTLPLNAKELSLPRFKKIIKKMLLDET